MRPICVLRYPLVQLALRDTAWRFFETAFLKSSGNNYLKFRQLSSTWLIFRVSVGNWQNFGWFITSVFKGTASKINGQRHVMRFMKVVFFCGIHWNCLLKFSPVLSHTGSELMSHHNYCSNFKILHRARQVINMNNMFFLSF